MSSRGVLSKIWYNFKQSFVIIRAKENFVGTDHLGNKYFERPSDFSNGIKEQRRIVPSDSSAEFPEVPVEWMTWLQGRRRDAPSKEEIERNFNSSAKIQARVKELENKNQSFQDGRSNATASSRQTKRLFPTYEEYEKSPGESADKDGHLK